MVLNYDFFLSNEHLYQSSFMPIVSRWLYQMQLSEYRSINWCLIEHAYIYVAASLQQTSYLMASVPHISLKQRWEFIKENKKVRKQENKNSTKKVIKKKIKFFLFFLVEFLFSWSLSWSSSYFLDRVLGRVLVFLFYWSRSWSSSCFLVRVLGRVLVSLFSYFLVFFYKLPPQLSCHSSLPFGLIILRIRLLLVWDMRALLR